MVPPHAHLLAEEAFVTCRLLHHDAFPNRPTEALARVDPLGPSLVDAGALRDCVAAFPAPPVCLGLGRRLRSGKPVRARVRMLTSHMGVVAGHR